MKACVDIGGTKVAVSLAEPGSQKLIARQAEPTAKTGRNDAVARQVLHLIDAACAEAGVDVSSIDGVGVSSTGPFVLQGGCVELATPNICGGLAGPARGLPNDWMTAVLEAPLRERFQRVRVENDAVAALEAERHWGALKGIDDCAYVTWSTGVGVGLCVGGHVLRGKNGNAGHVGHSFVSDDDNEHALCGCGNIGDVEGLVAGNALERRFSQPAADLFAAAVAGDAKALATTDALCRVMGRMLYNLVVTLDLQRISLGGSVFWHNREFLLARLQAQLDGKLPALTKGATLVAAGLGDKVGDYAALALLD
ncbi:ROK family protein [Variovorax ginsengisoli]|uniref:Glucokinase n=1 Tax=Variovorax ginsengisoli TaxID=363844 RepID=A0ABT9S4U3_9BURK|nr:ROK family protein [Variovorax ginsengisoli]MDP9898387.1 glucokinase [Variovorax ginsengisoli]